MSPNGKRENKSGVSEKTADLRDLHSVQFLCKFFAIVVLDEIQSSTRYRIFAGFLILVNTCGFLHSISGRYSKLLDKMDLAFIITDTLSNLLITAFIAMGILFSVFIYSKEVVKIRSLIQSCSMMVDSDCGKFYAGRKGFIIFNAGVLTLIVCDAVNWITSLGFEIFQYYLWRDIQVYHSSVIIFVIVYIALVIRYKLHTINECLKNNIIVEKQKKEIKVYLLTEPKTPLTDSIRIIKELNRKYGIIYEVVQVYNDVFGSLILLLLCISVTVILNVIDLMIVYNKRPALANIDGYSLIILCLLWITLSLVMPTLIAASCNGAAKEAEKTATICFALLNELPTIPKTENDRIIREELILLSHQATARCPKFSAAGFFNVDYSILGFILGTVTTYVIVILQFHGQ